MFWSSLLNIDIFPRKAAGSVIQPLYYLKQYLHLIYFSRYQWCLVNRYRGTRNINFFDLKIAKNRKVLIVQSVPINMGIKWRFLSCLFRTASLRGLPYHQYWRRYLEICLYSTVLNINKIVQMFEISSNFEDAKKADHILKMPRVDEFWGHCFEYHTFKRRLTNERHK